jgi:cytochrome P450
MEAFPVSSSTRRAGAVVGHLRSRRTEAFVEAGPTPEDVKRFQGQYYHQAQQSEESPGVNLPGPGGLEDSAAYNDCTQSFLCDQHERYGDRFVLRRDGAPVVFVRDLAAVRAVLNDEDFAKSWAADARIASDEDFDAAMDARMELKPMFAAVDAFRPAVNRIVDEAVRELGEQRSASGQLCHDVMKRSAFLFLCGDAAHGARAVSEEAFRGSGDAGAAVVAEYRRHEAERGQGPHSAWHGKCLFSILDRQGGHSDAGLAMLANIVVAGGEPPASGVAHLVHEMAFNATVQELLAATAGDFADAFILEGLAPATLVQRKALVDTELPGGLLIPKGTVVGICATAVLTNPLASDAVLPALPVSRRQSGVETLWAQYASGVTNKI